MTDTALRQSSPETPPPIFATLHSLRNWKCYRNSYIL